MNEIVMPKLSDTMTEGKLVSWKKRVGETVRRGDVLAEVETDKANMELEAFVSGELLEIRVQAGDMAEVGTVIAVIGEPGEKGAEPERKAPEQAQGGQQAPEVPETPKRPGPGAEKGEEAPPAGKPERSAGLPQSQGESQAPAAPVAPGTPEVKGGIHPLSAQTTEAGGPPAQAPEGGAKPGGTAGGEAAPSRERAAPVVRRRARELGIDLSSVKGSGPEGRILLQDLEGAEKPAAAEAAKPAAPGPAAEKAKPSAPQAAPVAEQGAKQLSRLRAAIAKNVSESWRSIPHFTLTMDIYMDEAEALRRQLKQTGVNVTFTDLIVKGAALVLQKYPQMNASFAGDSLQMHGDVNVCVAVAVPDGVLMPVIPGCQRLSLPEISKAARELAERARAGSLGEQEMSGGTFAVSNLGMYGVSQFSAIIYPSQSGVLAVGAVIDTAVVRNGNLASAKVMKVTLSADHRVVDGAYAAEFLAGFREILENPIRLLV